MAAAHQLLRERHYTVTDGNGKRWLTHAGGHPSFRQFSRFLRNKFSLETRIRSREGDKDFERDHRAKLGSVLEGCRGVGNVTVTVYPNLAGPDYADSCTTSADGVCHVSLPFQIPLTAGVDESNFPPGYVLTENPFYAGVAYTEFAAVVVLLLPDPRGD